MLWINGEEATQVSALDRGLAYGDGVFETMRLVNGELPLWTLHRDRLVHGLEHLGIPLEAAALDREVRRAAHRYGSGILKLTVTRGEGGRAYRPPAMAETRTTRIIQGRAFERDLAAEQDGIDAILCETLLGNHPSLGGIKHLNRLEQVLASRELQEKNAIEGLMRDAGGCVVEGTYTNLFVVQSGTLVTPPIRGGVSGVMRRWLLQAATEEDFTIEERALQLDEILAADEAFVCNSVIGIWPLRSLERQPLRSGTITRRLQSRVEILFAE